MHAIVSLLDPTAYQRVESLWMKLEDQCGVDTGKFTPYPHISWHLAEDYQVPRLAKRLGRIASRSEPLAVSCSGIGLFSGPTPVIFIGIVKNERLIRYQRQIWRLAMDCSVKTNQYYSPEMWMPHITLAHRGLTPDSLNCVMRELAYQPFNWEVRLDNLALVCQEGENVGRLKDRWDFPSAARSAQSDIAGS